MTCPACAVTLQMGRGPCTEHTPANPWAGRHPCPTCGSAEWTLPAEVYVSGTWRCCSCSVAFTPATAVAAMMAKAPTLTERIAELEAENAALRERVAELVEYERVRAYDRAERARRRWKGLDR